MMNLNKNQLNLIATVIDCEHKTAPVQDEGIPSIRTPNVGNGRLILENVRRVSAETYQKWTKRAIPAYPDLILAREAPVGNVALVPKNLKVCLGQRTVLIRPDTNKVCPEYLNFLLNSMKSNLVALSNGSTVGHLNVEDIRNLELPKLPPLPTQKKIAAILSAYDDLIENNTRRIALLERMAEELYKEWFVRMRFPGHAQTRFVKGIPEGWEVKKLGEILELAYGKALKHEERVDGDFPVFGSSGEVGSHNKYLVEGPGIIVGRKGNVGSVFWSNKSFFPIDTVYYVKSHYNLRFLIFLLKKIPFINSDAAVPGLNRSQAYSNQVFFPPVPLIEQFVEVSEPFLQQGEYLSKSNQILRQTRDRLLTRLISGKLSVEELDIAFPPSMLEDEIVQQAVAQKTLESSS